MQNTASLWVLLCEELESQRGRKSAEEHSAAARKFEEAAAQVFQKHPERLRDACEIAGDIHQSANAAGDARRCFEAALAMEEPTVDQRVRLSTKLALLCEAEGDFPEARRYYQGAIEAQDRPGIDRAGLATLLNNLGGLHRLSEDHAAAAQAYRRALEEALAIHGAHHPEVALIANNFGVACTDGGDLARAEELHLRALQVREEIFGSNHPDVGQSLANLAVVYHVRGQHEKAERFYRGALDTLSHFCAADDPQLARITANYHRLPQVHSRLLSKTTRL